MMYELVELDPETGDEDQTLSIRPGTWTEAKRHMDEVITEMAEEWDLEQTPWAWLMIRPARQVSA